MDTCSLKKYVYDNNKIEYVLQEIGCGNIRYHSNKEFYSASNYNGDNPSAVNVKNSSQMWVTNWTRQNDFPEGSDIFDLIQYNKQCSFVEAVKYLHKILGLDYRPYRKQEKKEKFDPLAVFKRVLSAKRRVDVNDIHTISEEVLNDYVPMLHISWFKEGIMPWTRSKFGIAYSYKHKRVIIPIRSWLDGSLLGFNQRTTIENYEELGVTKYFLTPTYQKSLNLYGLWENRDEIERKRCVVIVESEKSVLKRYSLNDGTCVALQGKSLSDEQLRIILGLDVDEVIICLDNDVSTEKVRYMCEKLYRFRKVSYVKDSWGLLGKKDSPCDARSKVYDFLMRWRVTYDETEHKEYLKNLER